MEKKLISEIAQALPLLVDAENLEASYDREADVLYITLRRAPATDSDVTDDNLILRYADDELIGITIPEASQRLKATPAKAARHR